MALTWRTWGRTILRVPFDSNRQAGAVIDYAEECIVKVGSCVLQQYWIKIVYKMRLENCIISSKCQYLYLHLRRFIGQTQSSIKLQVRVQARVHLKGSLSCSASLSKEGFDGTWHRAACHFRLRCRMFEAFSGSRAAENLFSYAPLWALSGVTQSFSRFNAAQYHTCTHIYIYTQIHT